MWQSWELCLHVAVMGTLHAGICLASLAMIKRIKKMVEIGVIDDGA